ncbi:MAG: DUF6261 family protein [Tannerellaceae bacterium]|jgi:hypothetical protein|nr:DUF6261 family protein [Tannerellaceae bacterium]
MKRIEDFYLPGMPQQQVFLFFQKVYRLMKKISDSKLQPKLSHFSNAITAFDAALKSVPNNHLAEKVSVENKDRDRAFEAICREADMLLAENPALGQKLKSILSPYDNLSQKTDEEKVSLFNTFLAELENQLNNVLIDDTKLSDYVSLLKCSNRAYKQYSEAYKIELTGKCLTHETVRTRKEAEKTYKKTVEFINAMLIYNGDTEYGAITDQINHVIRKNKKVKHDGTVYV